VGAEASASTAGHDEVNAVEDVVVEGKTVRAADEANPVGVQQPQEVVFAALEAPFVMGRVASIQVWRHVHEHDAIRLPCRVQGAIQEGQILVTRALRPLGRIRAGDLQDSRDAALGMKGDEARVSAGEREVHRAVDAHEVVRTVLVVEVVVADDADVRHG
jgi:hypothetical protein